jgi:hypothetical protein
MINDIESYRASTNTKCTSCNILGLLRNLNNCVKANSARYNEYETGADQITSLGTPTIPYAVIWGNANKDNFILERLLSSQGNAAPATYFDDDLTDCNEGLLGDLRKARKRAQVDLVLTALSGFFNTLASFSDVTSVDSSGNVTVDETKLYQALGQLVTTTRQNINAIRATSDATADILGCELIRHIINARWNLIVSGGYSVQSTITTTTTTINLPGLSPEDCCWSCYGEDDPEACIVECFNNSTTCGPTTTSSTTTTVTVALISQPTDGLLSKSEQLLDGATNTYEAVHTNHFQEQGWLNTLPYFRPLFDGQNVAFKVPRI